MNKKDLQNQVLKGAAVNKTTKTVIRCIPKDQLEWALRDIGYIEPHESLYSFAAEGVSWSEADPLRLAIEVATDEF